ncbi:MAG: GNAT family N-acetyltransferase [Clostridia bacterium]|nr:GNAT family N-acetyltransferase [Clostridia bacterium]
MRMEMFHGVPDAALAVRIPVFVEEQGFVDEVDEIDGVATHVVLFDEAEQPIATCRVFEQEDTYILGRLCVLKAHRGKGYGSDLVAATERYVGSVGGERLALHSQYHAKGFYEKLGYAPDGEIEDEQGCPHIWMVKVIKGDTKMDFLEIANARQSCRSFDADLVVEPEKLERILEAARLSPSASNGQPYHLTVCTGEKAKQVAKATQSLGANKFSSDAPVQIVISEKPNVKSALVGAKVTGTDYRSIDIGIAAAYLTAEATTQGLSTCILGWLDGGKLRELCGLDGAARLVISLGYAKADDKLRAKKRKTTEELITVLK